MLIYHSHHSDMYYFKDSARVLIIRYERYHIEISRYRVLPKYRLQLVHRCFRAHA